MAKPEPPPEPYETWLDYVVATADADELCQALCSVSMGDSRWDDVPCPLEIRAAARAELDDLRRRLYEATHLGSLD